jgi:hypothetical protein
VDRERHDHTDGRHKELILSWPGGVFRPERRLFASFLRRLTSHAPPTPAKGVLADSERILGPDHPETIMFGNNLETAKRKRRR